MAAHPLTEYPRPTPAYLKFVQSNSIPGPSKVKSMVSGHVEVTPPLESETEDQEEQRSPVGRNTRLAKGRGKGMSGLMILMVFVVKYDMFGSS